MVYSGYWSTRVLGQQSQSFGKLHKSFRPVFADGQCCIISSAETSFKTGGTATDARCGLQDSAFYLQTCFSWSLIMVLGKQNELVVQEFVFWFVFWLCEISTLHSLRQTDVNEKVFARRALRNWSIKLHLDFKRALSAWRNSLCFVQEPCVSLDLLMEGAASCGICLQTKFQVVVFQCQYFSPLIFCVFLSFP